MKLALLAAPCALILLLPGCGDEPRRSAGGSTSVIATTSTTSTNQNTSSGQGTTSNSTKTSTALTLTATATTATTASAPAPTGPPLLFKSGSIELPGGVSTFSVAYTDSRSYIIHWVSSTQKGLLSREYKALDEPATAETLVTQATAKSSFVSGTHSLFLPNASELVLAYITSSVKSSYRSSRTLYWQRPTQNAGEPTAFATYAMEPRQYASGRFRIALTSQNRVVAMWADPERKAMVWASDQGDEVEMPWNKDAESFELAGGQGGSTVVAYEQEGLIYLKEIDPSGKFLTDSWRGIFTKDDDIPGTFRMIKGQGDTVLLIASDYTENTVALYTIDRSGKDDSLGAMKVATHPTMRARYRDNSNVARYPTMMSVGYHEEFGVVVCTETLTTYRLQCGSMTTPSSGRTLALTELEVDEIGPGNKMTDTQLLLDDGSMTVFWSTETHLYWARFQ